MIKFFLGVVVGIGLVVLASYLFVTRGGIFMGTDAKPLPLEQTIAGAAITASIGKSADDPSPLPADETNLLAGAKIYMQACAGCHGRLDQASSGAKGFYPHPPHLLPPGTGVTDDPVGATHWVVKNGGPFQCHAVVQPETERLGNLASKSFAAERRQITEFGSGFAASTAARVKTFDSFAPAHLKIAPSPTRSLLPSQF